MKVPDPFRVLWRRYVVCNWVTVWGVGTFFTVPFYSNSVLTWFVVFTAGYLVGEYLVFEEMPEKERRLRDAWKK